MIEEKVILVKTATFADLIRLAVSTMIPHQFVAYLIKFKHKDKIVVGLLGIFRDYYKYYGVPIFYYYSFDAGDKLVDEANYVVVYTGEEKYELSKHPKPGSSIPIITLAEKPAFIPDDIE
ncbi:MAG: hypothetical protein QXJ16_01110 [Desulfurococcaceae archaeon]